MDAATWQRLKDPIVRALERPAAEREPFLRQYCTDPQLLALALDYLKSYQDMPTAQWTPPAMDPGQEHDEIDLPPGSRVSRYVILGNLGHGGMGHVFLGEDVDLHRKVALKSLLRTRRGGAGERTRIKREATAAAQVSHANVATVYDVIQHDDRWFIVMEYVEGKSLASLMRRERLSPDRVVAIGRQLASALVAAHAKGVIHRDLKPANIQITSEGSAKVLDFGVAGATTAFTTVSDTGEGEKVDVQPGTRGYMSPEQMLNRQVDERTDIFSAGIVLFEMATGERAFVTSDPLDLIAAIARPVRRADSVDAGVPRALADVIAKALEVDLPRRFRTAAELGAALEAVVEREGRVVAGPKPSIGRRLAVSAFWIVGVFVVLTALGLLTTRAYNIALERRGFDEESAAQWFRIGAQSIVAPLARVVFVVLAVGMFVVVRNLVLSFSSLGRRFDATSRDRLTHTARRMKLDDPSVLASWIVLVSACALLASWWCLSPLLGMIITRLSTEPAARMRMLAPIDTGTGHPDNPFDMYRHVLTLITFGSLAGWYLLRRAAIRSGRSLSWAVSAGAWLTILLAAVSLALPWRLAYNAIAERVEWEGQVCYPIGERPDRVLLFCPDNSSNGTPSRIKTAPRDGPKTLDKSPESIFTVRRDSP